MCILSPSQVFVLRRGVIVDHTPDGCFKLLVATFCLTVGLWMVSEVRLTEALGPPRKTFQHCETN